MTHHQIDRPGAQRVPEGLRMAEAQRRKVFNQSNDFQHKLSRDIVNNYGLIFVEDLNVKGCRVGLRNRYTMQDGQRSCKDFRTRLRVPDEGTCASILVGPASVARVEHQTSNGFRNVSMFASIADWLPHYHASAIEVLRLGLSLQPLTAVQ